MSVGRKIVRITVVLFIIVLLLSPIGMIWYLTKTEMRKYEAVDLPTISQKSYGDALPVIRKDMKEFIFVSGQYVSEDRFFMELPKLKNPYESRILVSVGDYIEEDELIGYSFDGKSEIYSTANGVINSIHLGEYSYIVLENDENLSFVCYADEKLISILSRNTLSLSDEKGNEVTLLRIERVSNEKGERKVFLQVNDGILGKHVNNLKLYTGKVFTDALVVPNNCLYRLPENPKQWYVRTIDANGNVIGDQQVQVGFSDGQYTCITGLSEGTLLDSGYAMIMGGTGDETVAD